jgi:hypothetical protein
MLARAAAIPVLSECMFKMFSYRYATENYFEYTYIKLSLGLLLLVLVPPGCQGAVTTAEPVRGIPAMEEILQTVVSTGMLSARINSMQMLSVFVISAKSFGLISRPAHSLLSVR